MYCQVVFDDTLHIYQWYWGESLAYLLQLNCYGSYYNYQKAACDQHYVMEQVPSWLGTLHDTHHKDPLHLYASHFYRLLIYRHDR